MSEDTARRLAHIRGRFDSYPVSVVAVDPDVQWMLATIADLTAERDELLAKAATWTCDGSTHCSSAEHLHGCYADNPCSHPLDR